MLDKQVFKKGMQQLLYAFPNWKIKLDDQEVARFWYMRFKDFENERFMQMVDKYIENEKFDPTIKSLKSWDIMPRKTRDQLEHEKMLKEAGLL